MKKLKFAAFMMGAVLMSAGFTACSSDDDLTGDHIIIAPASPDGFPKTGIVGELIEFDYLVTLTDNKLAEVEVIINNEKEPKIVKFDNKTSYAGSVSYKPEETGVLKISIIATDNKGASATTRFEVEVEVAAGDILIQEVTLLGSVDTNLPSFYLTKTGTAYGIVEAKTNSADVDFVYFYGSTNKATIAAPSDASAASVYNHDVNGLAKWNIKNETKFKVTNISAESFDLIEDDSEITAIEDVNVSLVNNLKEGDVIAFTTVTGKKGLFKVTELKDGPKSEIKIQVKIQE